MPSSAQRRHPTCHRLLLAAVTALLAAAAWAAPPLPPGGSVRTLAADPFQAHTVLLGTTVDVIYRSRDAGRHWQFYSRIAGHDDWVIAALVADAHQRGRWYAALWSWRGGGQGGVYASSDDGQSWTPLLLHHAVRALALARSDPNELVAATLEGVYRSRDAGRTWNRISPAGDRELMNIESVAIDPANPDEIYVGTWHLPWKTINGGHDWWQMRNGVIDDSDVFSIAVAPAAPATVYLSACSGIYRSDDHGNQFQKIQGIPYSARRTPALVPDPLHPATLYAGTTQGLWVSPDRGATWRRMTPPALRVNTVLLMDGRILLGTDFAGVFTSDDDGRSFAASNAGFASRHVAAAISTPAGHYLAVTGDERWGGVFFLAPGADSWRQLPPLPQQQDALALHWSPAGLVAATARGIALLAPGRRQWSTPAGAPASPVYALASPASDPGVVLAAGQTGLYRSDNGGRKWRWMRSAPAPLYRLLVAPGTGHDWLLASGSGFVVRSPDLGLHFLGGRLSLDTPGSARARIFQLAAAPAGPGPALLLAATSRGLYLSPDEGQTWELAGHG
ncbi:MAG: hypothetical protein ACRD1A_02585, partial [Terriglobales bacterium]